MHVTSVKKQLANGEPCRKCAEVDNMLRRRGLAELIDEQVILVEGDPTSPGAVLARRYGITTAPFFIVRHNDGEEVVVREALRLVKLLTEAQREQSRLPPDSSAALTAAASALQTAPPETTLRWALERFGARCVLAFSGAEDVILIDLAVRSGLPFSVLTLDTGRLHPQTYRFIERVRSHYGVAIDALFPDAVAVEQLVRAKGLFSFYEEGHTECCNIRKVQPLHRALQRYSAWVTGQRRDQSPTRTELAVLEVERHPDDAAGPLLKLNPLANWTSSQVWDYIRSNDVPYNELHDQGFVSIGCEPCTRALRPGEHERAARWWWEDSTRRECGLHVSGGDQPEPDSRPAE